MRHREHGCGASDPGNNKSAGPIFKHALNETAKNQFLADRHGDDDRKKRQALSGILRKYFQRDLRQEALRVGRVRGQAPKADKLIGENERCQHDRDNQGERGIWDGESETRQR